MRGAPVYSEKQLEPIDIVLTFISLLVVIFANVYLYVHTSARRRSFNTCDECGYLLKNLSDETDKCPECGNPISFIYKSM